MNAKQGLTDRGTSHDVERTAGHMDISDFSARQNRPDINRMPIPGDLLLAPGANKM